ncbi:hypothetical protein [Billgrantia kenyensis]|uniref:Uncharacterized protein n=1 Tax=Billgrantia kenyensis TaxID=321266 RepID=A0A7W0ADS4_9GAMM|nr:hypothetical protein [Halomonas kenyensis]MBA2779571.1 hypothetical protein [Halomonas kenyensis]MCG6662283.1 hypothetical protein [Halomonas kenyensis]
MTQRSSTVTQHRITRIGWCRSWLFSLLLLSMAVVFGVQATAHPEPASPHFAVAEELAQTNPPVPAPHCEHGHGREHGAEILLRGERLDADGTATHRPDPAVAPPPVATDIGMPSAAPTFARPPLYLLTQRLRP